MAIAGFVLSILWGFGITSAAGLVLGIIAYRRIGRSSGRQRGRRLAVVAIVLSSIGLVGTVALIGAQGSSTHAASGYSNVAQANVSSACQAATNQVNKDWGDGSNQWVSDVGTMTNTCTTMAALAGSGARFYGTVTVMCFGMATSNPQGSFNDLGPVELNDSQAPGCQDLLQHFEALGGTVDISNGLEGDSNFLPALLGLAKEFRSEGGTETQQSS